MLATEVDQETGKTTRIKVTVGLLLRCYIGLGGKKILLFSTIMARMLESDCTRLRDDFS